MRLQNGHCSSGETVVGCHEVRSINANQVRGGVVPMFCGIVERPSRLMDVLSISIVEQVFAISAVSIIIVEA